MEERCECGKVNLDKEAAERLIAKVPYLRRYYKCPDSGMYHVTKKVHTGFKANLRVLENELRQESMTKTIRGMIIEYGEKLYKEKGVDKFLSAEIVEYIQDTSPEYPAKSVRAMISTMVREGVLVKWEVPNDLKKRKIFFYSLSSVVEDLTNPNKSKDNTVRIPNPTPSSVAANSFDKVNTRLDEILTKIDGLIRGYTEVSRKLNQPVKVDTEGLKETIREELEGVVSSLEVPTAVSNAEDYKRGVQDGIKMAVEMGLRLAE